MQRVQALAARDAVVAGPSAAGGAVRRWLNEDLAALFALARLPKRAVRERQLMALFECRRHVTVMLSLLDSAVAAAHLVCFGGTGCGRGLPEEP